MKRRGEISAQDAIDVGVEGMMSVVNILQNRQSSKVKLVISIFFNIYLIPSLHLFGGFLDY